MYFHSGASTAPTASHDVSGREQSSRRVSREEVRLVSGIQYLFSLCGCSGRAGLVISRGLVLPGVHFFPFLQIRFLKGIATSDPYWLIPAHPFGHDDGSEGNGIDQQTLVEPSRSQQKVDRIVLDSEVQTLRSALRTPRCHHV